MAVCTKCGAENPEGFRFCGACGAPLGATPGRVLRKTVSVLFCDVTGSTALGERLDPEALRGVMARYFEEIRGVVERHGGVVEKFIGDAVMAVFGVPRAHEDDALRAVRAAVEIRARLPGVAEQLGVALRFRTGVNTGEAVVGTSDVVATGDAVNVAARLEQAAAPGEILIGALTYALVRDAVEVEQVSALVAKGKSEPLEAFRLERVDQTAPGRARRLGLPLVGRARELRLLHEAYERATAERRCHLFTLLGAAGIGKSRLIGAFSADAAPTAAVVSGRCLPYGDGITFWPLVEILRPLGDIAEPVLRRISEGGIASPNELFWEVRKVVEAVAAEQPLVVVFDDAQWAEPLLLDLIEHVVKLSRGAPLLVVCVARPELLDDRPSWGGGMLNATAILLDPLAVDECRELIASLDAGFDPALAEQVIRASEGNPLFVEEMVALAVDDGSTRVPPTIHAVLAARLERLDDHERAVLECGAIEGEVFHRGAVSALVATPAPILETHLAGLVQKELVRPVAAQIPGDEAYRFSHLLIRDAAYNALPKARRAELHQQFEHWLERHGGDLIELDQIAGWHLEQAIRYRAEIGLPPQPDLTDRASDRLAAAGRMAAGQWNLEGSETLLRRAIALLPIDDPGRPSLAVALAETLIERNRYPEAEALLEDPDTVAGASLAVELARCRLLCETDNSAWATTVLRARLPALQTQLRRNRDDRGLALVELLMCSIHGVEQQHAQVLAAAGRAAEHARRAGDRALLLRALAHQMSNALFGPQPRDAVEELIDELERSDLGPLTQTRVLWARSALAQYDGRFDEARRLMQQTRSILIESGDDATLPRMGDRLAMLELGADNPDVAITILEETRPQLAALGLDGYRATQTAHLADALYRLGRLDEAEQMARQAEAESAPDDTSNFIIIPAVLAHIHAERGDADAALKLAEQAVETAYRTDGPHDHARAELALAHARATAGQQPEAVQAARRALACYQLKGDHTSAARVENWIDSLANNSPRKTPA